MNLPNWTGYLVFFLLPILLWAIGAAVVRRKGFEARVLAFVAGSDNRLSLSRLQAFIWTLVIFGSFAAAMAVHTKIISGTKAEVEQAKKDATAAREKAASVKADSDNAAKAAKAAAREKTAADNALKEAEAKLRILNEINAGPELKGPAENNVRQARIDAELKAVRKTAEDNAAAEAETAALSAANEAKDAAAKAKSYDWVEIPAELLALAGIAIGSGVFSSLIAAVSSEDKTACVTSLESITQADLRTRFPDAAVPVNPNCLMILGKDMGKSGRVRLDKDSVPILLWKDDGTTIVVDVRDNIEYSTLTVDTPNGKLCYELTGKTPALILGLPKIHYEFADLFRDDKNPSNFDLMKFQMFGWTLVAVFIYVYLFLTDLRGDLESLPLVSSSIVILTGLSQAGYLTGKGVSSAG